VVVDDARMKISHVIRGDDHLSNTPKQVLLYRALGYPAPTFAHVPLILGSDGKRLSKRHGATAVGDYEIEGILPDAMVNFLALLGWNPGDEREVMSREELIEAFTTERILKKSSVFDVEKLSWLNGRHLAQMSTERLLPALRSRLAAWEGADTHRLNDDEWMTDLVDLVKVRARTVEDGARQMRPFVGDELDFDPKAVAKHWTKNPQDTLVRLELLRDLLASSDWTEEALEKNLRELAEERGVGAGKLIHPLRVALTGQGSSPGIFEVLVLLGRQRSVQRVEHGIDQIRAV
jgi:glutamyl-tRNA synthetase